VSFHSPQILWVGGVAVAALLLGHVLDEVLRARALRRLGDAGQLARMIASASTRRRRIKAALFLVGFAGVMIALARPRAEGETVWRQRGIDVAVVMDYSKSMLADDVPPSRLFKMQEEVEALMDGQPSDRFGLVVFAGAAAHFPITSDHQAARSLYEGMTPLDLPPGSNLDRAVLAARCILHRGGGCGRVGGRGGGGDPLPGVSPPKSAEEREQERELAKLLEERGRAMVIFTDGEDSRDAASEEVRRAIEEGIAVYFVGVGTAQGARVPEVNDRGEAMGWKRDHDGKIVVSRLAEDELRDLAAIAGGEEHLLLLEPGETAPALRERLESIKRGDLERRVTKRPKDIYQLFLFPALFLLLVEACLADRRRRTGPGDPLVPAP
jgi:Ca-activated chloride channel family protein